MFKARSHFLIYFYYYFLFLFFFLSFSLFCNCLDFTYNNGIEYETGCKEEPSNIFPGLSIPAELLTSYLVSVMHENQIQGTLQSFFLKLLLVPRPSENLPVSQTWGVSHHLYKIPVEEPAWDPV